jgi:LacI family transcriptional regulator
MYAQTELFMNQAKLTSEKSIVTIRDLAQKLDISVSTVSRALRGRPEVSLSTRKAVIKMASKLQYQPNLVAQNLRNRKTRSLGIIVPDLVTHFFQPI